MAGTPNRYYSAIAQDTTLSSPATAGAVSITVTATAGFPNTYPYTLALDWNTSLEELVDVTSAVGLTLAVTRAADSTVATNHGTGAVVRHVLTARDIREAQQHIVNNTGVHGVTGNVVGTTDVQVVTNKDSTSTTNTFALDDSTLGSLPRMIAALAQYNDFNVPTLRIIGLGSSVGVGATLPSPTTQSPVAYFGIRFAALFNKLNNLVVTTTNGSVNGHACADLPADYTAAKTLAGGVPFLVPIIMGMNDGGSSLYHNGQTLPGVKTFLDQVIDSIRADGGEPIIFTSPHPNTSTYDFTYMSGSITYPSGPPAIPALTAVAGAPTADFIGDGGASITISYRHLRVNQMMRLVAQERGVALVDAERYWFKALRTSTMAYGASNSIFNSPETVHPNLLGHQLSYQAAIDSFLARLQRGVSQSVAAPSFSGAMGINTPTPLAALHITSRSITDKPLRATRSTGADALLVNDDGSATLAAGFTAGGPITASGAPPAITGLVATLATSPGQFYNISAVTTMFALADNEAGLLIIEGIQAGVGRQISVYSYVGVSGSSAYVIQLGSSTGSSTNVFSVASVGAAIQVTPNYANTNIKITRINF